MPGETDSAVSPVRKRVRVAGVKICEVCGDKALAHHFGALSCETCKAFFRRNGNMGDKLKRSCADGKACVINKDTRKNCPACRLQKCFSVGMKAELIYDAEQKQKLNEKMQKNCSRHQGPPQNVSDSSHEQRSVTSNSTDAASKPSTVNTRSNGIASFSAQSDKSETVIKHSGGAGNVKGLSENGNCRGSSTMSSSGCGSGVVSSHVSCQSGTEISQTQGHSHSICSVSRDSSKTIRAQTCACSDEQAQGCAQIVTTEFVPPKKARICARTIPTASATSEQTQSLCQGQGTAAAVNNIDVSGSQVLHVPGGHEQNALHGKLQHPVADGRDNLQPQTQNLQFVSECITPRSQEFDMPASPDTICSADDMHQISSPEMPHGSMGAGCETGCEDKTNSNKEVFHPSRPDLSQLSLDQLPSDPLMYWRLSEEERLSLMILAARYENIVLSELQKRMPSFDMKRYTLHEFLCDYELLIRQAVLFAKQLEDFKRLTLDDQIACIKGSISSVMIVRSAFTFIVERSTWVTLRGELTVGTVKKLFPGQPVPDSVLGTYRSLKSVLKNDTTLYALLHCILLFDPSYDKILDRQLVSTIQDEYLVLLRHYLESTFSYTYAREYERYIQDKILEMADVNEFNRRHTKVSGSECAAETMLPYELLIEVHSK